MFPAIPPKVEGGPRRQSPRHVVADPRAGEVHAIAAAGLARIGDVVEPVRWYRHVEVVVAGLEVTRVRGAVDVPAVDAPVPGRARARVGVVGGLRKTVGRQPELDALTVEVSQTTEHV